MKNLNNVKIHFVAAITSLSILSSHASLSTDESTPFRCAPPAHDVYFIDGPLPGHPEYTEERRRIKDLKKQLKSKNIDKKKLKKLEEFERESRKKAEELHRESAKKREEADRKWAEFERERTKKEEEVIREIRKALAKHGHKYRKNAPAYHKEPIPRGPAPERPRDVQIEDSYADDSLNTPSKAVPRNQEIDLPTATRVPGKGNLVYSPYLESSSQAIDISDFKPGDLARDPYSGKTFLVP